MARDQIDQHDKIIAELRRQSAVRPQDQCPEEVKSRLQKDQRTGDTTRQDLAQQRSELAQKLDAAMSSSQALQQKLDSLAEQSAQDAARGKTLEAGNATISNRPLPTILRWRHRAKRDRLHRRRFADVKELMGARDLYIAEVHDVARDGHTQIPYGRVFYTKGKSLIFYAYDLDRQTELKRAGSFQAWGRRGPDREQAVNLGVFYEDSAAKKRWILKCDNPKTLAQIDAILLLRQSDQIRVITSNVEVPSLHPAYPKVGPRPSVIFPLPCYLVFSAPY